MYNGLKWINSTMSLEMNNDVNVNSLTNKNFIRWNGSNWVNVADLTNAETYISKLQVSTGILVNTTNTAQHATIVTSFSDSSSGNPIIHGNATSPSIITPTATTELRRAPNKEVCGSYLGLGPIGTRVYVVFRTTRQTESDLCVVSCFPFLTQNYSSCSSPPFLPAPDTRSTFAFAGTVRDTWLHTSNPLTPFTLFRQPLGGAHTHGFHF